MAKIMVMFETPATKGDATKFWLGDGFIGIQIHPPQKFSFSSDFSHFI